MSRKVDSRHKNQQIKGEKHEEVEKASFNEIPPTHQISKHVRM